MEQTYSKISRTKLSEYIQTYQQIFPFVRLLNKDELELLKRKCESGLIGVDDDCFFSDPLKSPCNNCVSVKSYTDKSVKTKLETLGSDIYIVIAEYVEADEKPYVIEMLKPVDHDRVIPENPHEPSNHLKYYTDVLTNTYNRRYYEEKIKDSVLNAGVAMIDIDDFKIYNDLYGHSTGDKVLGLFTKAIQSCLRGTDMLIRYGGDEFLLIMPGINEKMMLKILDSIKRQLRDITMPDQPNLRISASIGVAVCKDENINPVVDRADQLMMLAKIKKNEIFTEKDLGTKDKTLEEPLVLIADDSLINRELIASMLGDKFRIIEACDGEECISALKKLGGEISILLLDIIMPGKNGFDVLSYMNSSHMIEDIPVIIITGDNSESSIQRAYDMGITDYIRKPFDSKAVYNRVYNTIKLYAKQRRIASLITDKMKRDEREKAITMDIVSSAFGVCNIESKEHVISIYHITKILLTELMKISEKYTFSNSEIEEIAKASMFHDIGKIGVNNDILSKPGKLTQEEFEEIKKHTVIGDKIIRMMPNHKDNPFVETIRKICRWHHERYDGNGYPDGLVGDEIPIGVQAVSVADVYNALVSKRIYKDSFPHEKAMEMILNGECGKFNPILIECLKNVSDIIRNV